MPYSALHAMMCCHTNEGKPRSPSFRFSSPSESSFSFVSLCFSLFFEYHFPVFSTSFFFSVINVPGLCEWISRLIRDTKRWKDVTSSSQTKEKEPPESSANTTALIHIFVLPPFDSVPRRKTSSLFMYKTEKCKIQTKKKNKKINRMS